MPMTVSQKNRAGLSLRISRFWILIQFLIVGIAAGQPTSIRFDHLTSEDGLSQVTIEAILQDKSGFMWFGSADGLNRYDGYNFKIFRHQPVNPNSLTDNNILALAEDEDGKIWIGTTGGGLNCYDPKLEVFRSWRHDESNPQSLANDRIDSLLIDNRGILWVGTANGLSRFNKAEQNFTNFRHDPQDSNSLSSNRIRTIYQDGAGDIWVGLMEGPLHRMMNDGVFKKYNTRMSDIEAVVALCETSAGEFWVGASNGLFKFDRKAETFQSYKHSPMDSNTLSDPWADSLLEDSSGRLWVGTGKGLSRLSADGEHFDRFLNDPSDPFSLSHNAISTLYEDRSDTLWIATSGGGLNTYNQRQESFHLVERSPATGLSINGIWGFLKDRDDNLWVSTWGDGLNVKYKERERFIQFRHDPTDPESLSHNDVRSQYMDRLGNLWFGTVAGLNRFNPRSKTFTHYGESEGLSSETIFAITNGPNGLLWVGTGHGINVLDVDTGSVTQFLHHPDKPGAISHDRIRAIYMDSAKKVWVATNGGLNLLESNKTTFKRFGHDPNNPQSLSHDEVRAILEDDLGRLWVGTSNGLNRFDPEMGVFQTFHQADGLPNDCVYGILEDGQGYLWISTNMGLSRMDPDNQSFLNFGFGDGLQDNEFNHGAAFKDRSGRLYFGGNKGFNAFFPGDIKINTTPPPVVITGFTLFNKPVLLQNQDPGSPLSVSPPYLESIVLDHGERVFSFEFTALQFFNPSANRFAFRLKGFEKAWNYTNSERRYATYTHMSHGNYEFQVKAAGRDGFWSERPKSVNIYIKPPWWRTWWFYILCIFIVGFYIRQYTKTQRKNLAKERALNERINRELELKVAERTRELKVKNKALDTKYRELETLDRIVQTINRELTFEDVIRVLLEQGLVLIPQAQRAIFIHKGATTNYYHCIAQAGKYASRQEEIIFSGQELYDLFGSKMAYLDEGIYTVSYLQEQIGEVYKRREVPKSLASLSIELEGQLADILILGNYDNTTAFEELDPKLLSRLREHAISAVAKARALQNLVQTQKDLVDAAHYAGMAEVAVNVLHDMGNTFNSVRTSVHILDDVIRGQPLYKLLGKTRALFKQEPPAGTADHQAWRSRLDRSLQVIFERWSQQHQWIGAEIGRLDKHIQSIVVALQEQQSYSRRKKPLEPMDLNLLVQEALACDFDAMENEKVCLDLSLAVLPTVLINKSRFMRSLNHLIKNAYEAISASTGTENTVQVLTSTRDGWVYLEIIDTGIGIHKENLASVYVNGFTTKPDARGHGLHYCANAIKEMNGRISIESGGTGEGTRVVVALPAVNPASS